jgi:hypothetical protein
VQRCSSALYLNPQGEKSVKQIRKRVTYANVMSSIAVFLVLGGASAYAAKKIGSNEIKGNSITTGKIKKEAVSASKIKKNSITTVKIANGAVTGAKLNLGTVGTVPNAAHANSADNANNANTVGGQTVAKFSAQVPENGAEQTVLNVQGLKLTATCAAGLPALIANSSSSSEGAVRYEGIDNLGETIHSGTSNFTATSNLALTQTGSGAGTIDVVFQNGVVVTAQYAWRSDGFGGASACRVFGRAIGG